MKTKNPAIIWIAAACAIFLLLVIYLFSLSKKRYDWSESYYLNDNEPFCISVLADIMEGYHPGSEFSILKRSPDTYFDTASAGVHNYMYVGRSFHMEDTSLSKFLDFIYRGNTALIAVNSFSDEVRAAFFPANSEIEEDTDEMYIDDSTEQFISKDDSLEAYMIVPSPSLLRSSVVMNVNLNFTDKNFASTNGYPYTFEERDIPYAYEWQSFNEEYINAETEAGIEPLGRVSSGGYNFIQIDHGTGRILLFTTPIVLTNYYLIEKDNLEYTAGVLSYLPAGDILWDEYSKQNHGDDYSAPESEGPLQFILSQKALRWGWYTMLAGLLLFIIFRSKRTQQIIPITEPNINKSLEFVQTIGRMYFMRNDQKKLVQQKMKLFLYYLKDKYKISNPEVADFYTTLSMRSQIPADEIQRIFETYKELENKMQVSDKELLHFHEILNTFYKNCK